MLYWFCLDKGFSENSFLADNMPVIIQGSRGSGKTTLLKYFSIEVQQERAKQDNITILEQIIKDNGVGFYFRCDKPFLDMFQEVFETVNSKKWVNIFEHYLELYLDKNILELLLLLMNEFDGGFEDSFIKKFHLDNPKWRKYNNVRSLYDFVVNELNYISEYKNQSIFIDQPFQPKEIFQLYSMSLELVKLLRNYKSELNDVNVVLLVDEFENLPEELQRLFNKIIKFCKPEITYRVGRRSENIITTATVNADEYLREQNDYKLIVLDTQDDSKERKKYFKKIAEKRLKSFSGSISMPTDIEYLLGTKENLDEEVLSIAKGRKLHLRYILEGNKILSKDADMLESVINIIANENNIIAEALNALWVARSKSKDLISYAHSVADTMRKFFCNEEGEDVEKYENDYRNKYRYALTVLICAAYRKNKSYYSFNTICYLTEGNTRTFLNICKAIISDALFYERETFIENGVISPKSQTRAIYNFAKSEYDSVFAIIKKGSSIRNLINGLGNVFARYHKDREVKYPETNQFYLRKEELNKDARECFDLAESWLLIIKKKKPKRATTGVGDKTDLYTINKMFAPLYNISYRTRGGFNAELNGKEIEAMIMGIRMNNKLDNSKLKSVENSQSVVEMMQLFE